jgi:signal transduction histidine kinase
MASRLNDTSDTPAEGTVLSTLAGPLDGAAGSSPERGRSVPSVPTRDVEAPLAEALGLSLLYVVVALGSLWLSRQPGSVATLWYSNAIAMAALATRPPARWPLMLGGIAIAVVAANHVWGDPLPVASRFVLPNLAEIVLAAALLRWRGWHRIEELDARDFLGLLGAAALMPPALGATLGAAMLGTQGQGSFGTIWLTWFQGAAVSVVSVLPLALAVRRMPTLEAWRRLTRPGMVALLLGVAALTAGSLALLPFPYVFLSTLLLLAAVAVDLLAIAAMSLVISLALAVSLALGTFVPSLLLGVWHQVYVFVYLALIATLVPAQVLAVTLGALRRSHAELARRERELSQANESLERFVHVAAHDLREPLNTVQQFAALLDEDHGSALPAQGREFLTLVRKGGARMRGLLDDMLEYTRAQQPVVGEPQPVVLDDVLAEVRSAIAGRLRESGGQLAIDLLPVVRGHRTLLALLFQNLVSNALKFVPPERAPEVLIYARRTVSHHEIVVADNGIGIAAEDIQKLFVPFMRLNLRRHYEGTGLGLALCRHAAHAHGGEIVVRSRQGLGSEFVVRLPR